MRLMVVFGSLVESGIRLFFGAILAATSCYDWFYQTLAEQLLTNQTLLVVMILVSLASPF